ncbi:ABC transporter substrate-binding protein [Kutzneria buriramensis]|uniref:Multiple sugar transport system substrate-binding protein n=1 Tax=Kutzneria buriramensis TaxID=1045776 RepID=A0A3E0I7E9_9PSEU|nr:extracellular solute-binding protein [Kutzneria buriramensis]REH54075.1 multiple sugar transport system substrate-binding protein [Kutzneria buriramensis]
MGTMRCGGRVLAVVAALAVVTTACGGGSGSGDGTTLSMWTFKQTHVKALEAAAAVFKAQTGITVNITAYTPDDTYTSKVQSAAASHNVADVLEVHAGGEDRVLGGAGIISDLAPDVNDQYKSRFLKGTADTGLITEQVYQDSLKPKATDPGVQKGQLYSVPFTAGTFGIVYANKDMLTAAGVDASKPPSSWQELISWLKATHDRNPRAGGVTMGLKSSSTGLDWALEPMAFAQLGRRDYEALFGTDKAKSWGSPNGQKVLEQYDQLTPYWTAGTQTLAIDEADRAFAQGKSAFDVGGTFTISAIQQNGLNPDKILSFPIPAPEGSVTSDFKLAPIALTGLSLSAQTPNRDAALKWVDFLTRQQQAGAFAQAALDLPGTDLGADASKLVGPYLSTMEAAFGSGDSAYNPGDSTFMGPTWDIEAAGDILVKMSPLKELDPAGTNAQLAVYNNSVNSGK